MSIQACEGVWRQKCGRYVAVIPCDRREGGQRWTDGIIHYFDDGTVTFAEGGSVVDLVEYIGPFPYSSQRAPVSRPAETESTTAVAGGVSEDPGRIIYDAEEKLKTANATIDQLRTELEQSQAWRTAATDAHSQSETLRIEQATKIEQLQAEWRSEFNAAQQLRSEVAQLEQLLDETREELQQLQADQAADEQHSEGERAAYLEMIKALWEMRA